MARSGCPAPGSPASGRRLLPRPSRSVRIVAGWEVLLRCPRFPGRRTHFRHDTVFHLHPARYGHRRPLGRAYRRLCVRVGTGFGHIRSWAGGQPSSRCRRFPLAISRQPWPGSDLTSRWGCGRTRIRADGPQRPGQAVYLTKAAGQLATKITREKLPTRNIRGGTGRTRCPLDRPGRTSSGPPGRCRPVARQGRAAGRARPAGRG
jgi:hypothetical protein